MKDTLPARFWAKVPGVPHIENVTPMKHRDRCWPWAGAHIPQGYGSIGVNGRQVGAHRVAYELMRGPIPDGMQLDHLCRNRGCVNPWHLEAVTLRENLRRGAHNKRDQTHCQQGHPFSGDNLLVDSLGRRICLTCRRANRRRRYHERARAAGIKKRSATHCENGHPLPPKVPGQRRKGCPTCHLEYSRRYRKRQANRS